VIVDSQSVKPLRWSLKQSYDAAKQMGRKRHLTVDTLGLVLRVFVSAANVGERKGAKRGQARQTHGQTVSRVHTVWVDGAMMALRDLGHGRLPLDCPSRITTGADQRLCLAQKRWVVERTFGWLMGSRRLVRDYELLPQTSETFIYLAMIRLMVKRLA